MRKYLFSILITIVIFYTYTNNSNNVSNGNGWNSCSGCHSGGSGTTTVDSIRLININTGATMTGYYPDSTYTIRLMGKNTASLGGFGFIARVVNASSAVVGSYTGTQSGTGTISSGTMWTQSSIQSPTGSNYVVTATWKAPTGQGTLSLQGIINAVNSNGGTGGDVVSSAASFSVPILGIISSITCGSATSAGTLTNGVAASGVTITIPYSGGNAGPHFGQVVNSTGVTGLTATLTAGNFASGAGNLSYTISGTPTSAGTASFAINIGTKTCTHTVTVGAAPGTVTSLNCASGTTTGGAMSQGANAAGKSINVPYSGGNGGVDSAHSVGSTGVTGLTATHSAGILATGNGTAVYNITGTPSTSGRAYFNLKIGGKTCTYSDTVLPVQGTIDSLDCANNSSVGVFHKGVNAPASYISIPYPSSNGGSYPQQTFNSTGVTGLVATLFPGNLNTGGGTLNYQISGVPSNTGTATFNLKFKTIDSCIAALSIIAPDGTIDSLVCSTKVDSGTLLKLMPATNGEYTKISYLNGNGKVYPNDTFASTGVTGLKAVISSGNFATGSGTLTINFIGTPSDTGNANFSIVVAGKSCNIVRRVDAPDGIVTSIHCDSGLTSRSLLVTVPANGTTFKILYKGGNGGLYTKDSVSSTGVTGYTAILNSSLLKVGDSFVTYLLTGVSNTAGIASFPLTIAGKNCTFNINVTLPPDSVKSLLCGSAIWSGQTLKASTTPIAVPGGITIKLPYTGGNGGNHNGQVVNSTGVTGIIATTPSGTLNIGDSNVIYTLSGVLSGYGPSSFAFKIGTKTCNYNFNVLPHDAGLATLECNLATLKNPIIKDASTTSNTITLPYRGGDGGFFPKQVITSTVVTNMTATLDSGFLKRGDSFLVLNLSGTPTTAGTAIFTITLGGKTCNIQIPVEAIGKVNSLLNCANGISSEPIVTGSNNAGKTFTVNYTAGNGGKYPAQTINSTGITGLTASLAAGTFKNGDGSVTYALSGQPSGEGITKFALNLGGATCSYEINVIKPQASVSSLTCGSMTGELKENEQANGVSFKLGYAGSNGGKYDAITISSTSVFGLEAVLSAGTLIMGDGEIDVEVGGTPLKDGKAIFKITIGNRSAFCGLSVLNTDIVVNSIKTSDSEILVFKKDNQLLFQNSSENIIYKIYNVNGLSIASGVLHKNENSISLNHLNLSKGIYILNYQTNKKTGSLKFDY